MSNDRDLLQRMDDLEAKMDALIECMEPIAASASSVQNLKAELARGPTRESAP